MKATCAGRKGPTDAEVESGWTCDCGHDFDQHDFDFDYNFKVTIETCGRCEHMPRLLRLAAEPLDKEPVPPRVLPGQRRLF